MIRFFILFWVCCVISPLSAYAQDTIQWSDEQLKSFYDEAQVVKRGCETNTNMNTAYACDCLAAHTYDARVKGDVTSSSPILLQKILPKCGNAPMLAMQKYQYCLESMSARRRDAQTYCQCFSAEFAKYYEKLPSTRPAIRIQMMTEAHRVCGERYPLPSTDNRREIKKELKERGLFERLFPGLSDLNK